MTQRDQAFADGSAAENYERYLVPYVFQPWCDVLLDMVVVAAAATALDVAAGTGVVSRAAARRAGPSGRVLASDISSVMVAHIATQPAEPEAAPIEAVVASATDLGRPDGEFDIVLCQQGLPFFPDRPGALREMHRVLRPGGVAGLAVWSGRDGMLPFGPFHDVLRDAGVPEPFPNAWDTTSFSMRPDEVEGLLRTAGFEQVISTEAELVTRWPDLEHLVDVIKGSPFAPVLAGLPSEQRDDVRRRLRERYAQFARDGKVEVLTYATLARAVG